MRKAVKRATGLLSLALILALAVSVCAECTTAAEMTESQMACCVAMGSECGHHAQDMSCCSTESTHLDQASPAERMPTPRPDWIVGPLVTDQVAPHALGERGYHYDGFTPKPPGIPRYLLVSTLLI
jgi:hypothetical protein